MTAIDRLLRRIPWTVSAGAVAALAAALAIAANLLIGPYFERSFLDEASPLAASGGTPTATGGSGDAPAGEPTPAAASTMPAEDAGSAGVLLQGEWRDGAPGHNGEGVVKIFRTPEGMLVLRVEEFSVTNGPDLFVVLSPDDDGFAEGALYLGGLKATDGNFNYEIPDGTDLSRFRSAVVWCRGARVTFAYATLEEA